MNADDKIKRIVEFTVLRCLCEELTAKMDGARCSSSVAGLLNAIRRVLNELDDLDEWEWNR